MSSQKPPKTLGKLEFLDIKKSLIEYLQKQTEFSGYEYEGSALSTLLDVLAYNSYYYAVYSNMMISEAFLDSAQRIPSLISLTKPLGYTIPSKTAAKIKVKVTQIPNGVPVLPKYSTFYGKDENGIQFTFYSLEDISIADSQSDPETPFYIYEGKALIDFDAMNQIDIERQRLVIADTDFDLETLEVQVKNPQTNIYEVWNRIGNVGYSNTVEENVYFVERIETGFIISFGLLNSVGKNITEDVTSVRVRYLRTNGSSGNQIFNFSAGSFSGTVVANDTGSFGGKDDPANDTIKFLAPRWFAAQERAVTVNDYKSLLLEAGFFGSENEFNIYGGEDIFPRRYGRVFITSSKPVSEVTDMMYFIKERSVVTVLPEYVNSIPLNVFINFRISFTDGIARSAAQKNQFVIAIKAIFNERYGKNNEYNLSFDANDFITYVSSVYPFIAITQVKLFVEQVVDATLTDYNFNLQNAIGESSTGLYVISEPFTSTLTSQSVIYSIDNTISGVSQKPLRVTSSDLSIKYSGNFGVANIGSGYINIKSQVMTEPTKFTIPFRDNSISIGLNNLVSFNIKTITVV